MLTKKGIRRKFASVIWAKEFFFNILFDINKIINYPAASCEVLNT